MNTHFHTSRFVRRWLVVIVSFAAVGHAEQRCGAAESGAARPPAAASEAVERDATVFGFNIRYREAGQGPAVILLHGLGGDGSRWTATMAHLAEDFRVISPDQIGFGQSDKPLANYNHALLAEFLAEFMQVVDAPKATLLGHSMGAWVAMHVALEHPEMVDRLILLNGGNLVHAPRSQHLIHIQNSTTLAETREYFELMFFDKSRVTDQMVRDNYNRRLRVAHTIRAMQEARKKGIAMLGEDQARHITAPTLIIWGRQDKLLEPAAAAHLERVIPNARAVLLDECGHIPQIEQPEAFHQLVYQFLQSPDEASGAD